MSVINMNHLTLKKKPLGSSNCQVTKSPSLSVKTCSTKKASADSTGIENDTAKIIKHHHSVKKLQTVSVAKRNRRERTRVKGVNDGFGKLKMHVPEIKNKSSKVETLRGAIEYIKRLKELLGEEIDCTPIGDIKFEEDDSNDSSSAFSDLPNSSSSNQSLENCLPPMVYQLPTRTTYHHLHAES